MPPIASRSVLRKEYVTNCRVSSVLNRDVKHYGKQFLFDNEEDTCWNSEKGSPQWIAFELKEDVPITGLSIQFQGGFAGKRCLVSLKSSDGKEDTENVYPEDDNAKQYFDFSSMRYANKLTITFEESTDFFGRIIVYSLEILKDQAFIQQILP